ncbi:MAG: chromate transporter [Eubacteriales bacterium]|nr:chromate transporter [Eubacteriales bacterium]
MIYLQLFWSFLQIGCLSFGGGYAAMSLIREQVVVVHPWLPMDAFANLVSIAEMTPGPIAINAATFVGTRVAGFAGAAAATVGYILPSCIFVTILSMIYTKYKEMSMLKEVLSFLRPAVVSMIAKAGLTILITAFFAGGVFSTAIDCVDWRMAAYFAAALLLLRKWKWTPIRVMVLGGVAEMAFTWLSSVRD